MKVENSNLQIFEEEKENGFSPSIFIFIKNLRRLKSSFGPWDPIELTARKNNKKS
jgi:hypothetical protein